MALFCGALTWVAVVAVVVVVVVVALKLMVLARILRPVRFPPQIFSKVKEEISRIPILRFFRFTLQEP